MCNQEFDLVEQEALGTSSDTVLVEGLAGQTLLVPMHSTAPLLDSHLVP